MALKVTELAKGNLQVVERPIKALNDTVMIRELSRKRMKEIYENEAEDDSAETKLDRLIELVSSSLTDEEDSVMPPELAREMLEENSNPAFAEIVSEILIVNGYEAQSEGES